MAARAKVILFGHRRWTVRFCVGGQLLNLLCASGWQFCSTEVELFVLISLCSLAKRGIEVSSDVIFL